MMDLFERHRKYWELEPVNEPLIGISKQGVFFLQPFINSSLMDGLIKADDIPEPPSFKGFYDTSILNPSLTGDLLMSLFPPRAIPWTELLVGCDVILNKEANIFSAIPPSKANKLVDLNQKTTLLKFIEQNPWNKIHLSFLEWLSNCYEGLCLLGHSLLRGPSDMMAAFLGSQQFYTIFYDQPETAKRLAWICTELWISSLCQQYCYIRPYSGGYGAGVMGLWAPGTVAIFQEDAAGLVSKSIYEKFFYPCDCAIASNFSYSLIHLHSSTLQFLDIVLTIPKLSAVNIVIDPLGPGLLELMPKFNKVQCSKKALHIQGNISTAEVHQLTNTLSPIGLCIYQMDES